MTESEVTWTTEIPPASIDVDFDAQQASLHLKNVLVFDTFTVANSLDPHHPIPKVNAVLNSLRMHWSGSINRRSHTDCVDAFRGEFIEDVATIEVVATTPKRPASACPPRAAQNGFRFVSDPADTSISNFAQIGRERNGVFFA